MVIICRKGTSWFLAQQLYEYVRIIYTILYNYLTLFICACEPLDFHSCLCLNKSWKTIKNWRFCFHDFMASRCFRTAKGMQRQHTRYNITWKIQATNWPILAIRGTWDLKWQHRGPVGADILNTNKVLLFPYQALASEPYAICIRHSSASGQPPASAERHFVPPTTPSRLGIQLKSTSTHLLVAKRTGERTWAQCVYSHTD